MRISVSGEGCNGRRSARLNRRGRAAVFTSPPGQRTPTFVGQRVILGGEKTLVFARAAKNQRARPSPDLVRQQNHSGDTATAAVVGY